MDYLQVEIKKKCQHTKRKYDENIKWKSIYQNNENTVDDDLGNVESATDDAATKENLLEHAKKFLGYKFLFLLNKFVWFFHTSFMFCLNRIS